MLHDIKKQLGIPYKEVVYSIRHHTVPPIRVNDQRISVTCPVCNEQFYVEIGHDDIPEVERKRIAQRTGDLLKESCKRDTSNQ